MLEGADKRKVESAEKKGGRAEVMIQSENTTAQSTKYVPPNLMLNKEKLDATKYIHSDLKKYSLPINNPVSKKQQKIESTYIITGKLSEETEAHLLKTTTFICT